MRLSHFALAVALLPSCTRSVGAGSFEEEDSGAEPHRARLDKTGWPTKLVWGLVPFLPEAVLQREFGRLSRTVARRLGIDVELVVARDYEDLRHRLREGRVDLAQLAALNYVRAKRETPDLALVVTHVADGSPTYQGYLLVRATSPARSVEDLWGHRVCWVDPDSSSGFVYPRALLRKRGIDPDAFFSDPPVFAGNHAAAIDRLLDGECDVAAVYSGAVKQAWSRGVDREALRIVAKTERIPYDAYCLRPGLPESFAIAIRRELLRISTRTGEGRAVLGKATRINGFMIAYDDHYDSVRRIERYLEQTADASGGSVRSVLDAPAQ